MAIDLVMAMRVFHAVVEAGSFAAAADRLELSRGMATRYVAQLEEHLGVRLLHRTTRKLSLTGGGADYHERAAQILALVEEAERSAAEESATPRGVLRVTCPPVLANTLLAPQLAAYLRQFPGVEVELSLNDRVVDLVDEGFDLALRISRQVDPGLIARPLMAVTAVTCAAPSYLKRCGTPRTPQDLASHECLHAPQLILGNTWTFTRRGETQTVKVQGRLRANHGEALLNAALAGAGIIHDADFLVAEPIRRGQLVRLLPGWGTGSATLYAVWANRRFLPPKVRSFVDFLAAAWGPPQPAVSGRSSRRA